MYIIAEIGINHNGDINLALEMMKAAKQCGAHCVKFQKRNPDVCVPEEQKNKPREWLGQRMTYLEYKKAIEFEKEEYDKIAAAAKEIGIDWTASVWDIDSLNFMLQYRDQIPFIKVPSACMTDFELLEAINKANIPVLLSGGMCTLSMVYEAMNCFNYDNIYGLLHCNSTYPSDENELDLNVIKTYKQHFNGYNIGYSSHDVTNFPCALAAAAGATIIERHFTLDKALPGTDQSSSVEPEELVDMIELIKQVKQIMGKWYPTFYKSEQKIAEKLRRV